MNNYKNCHLWTTPELTTADAGFPNLEIIKTYEEDSHNSRRLVRCVRCGQLYYKEFFEEIDWIGGEDPQYQTLVPVPDEATADAMGAKVFKGSLSVPVLIYDWPKDGPKRIFWQGRESSSSTA